MSAVVNGAGKVVDFVDQRITASNWLKRNIRKAFPDHWSFLLGEIALFSFILILLSGTFLTLWFKPSMQEVLYDGAYVPLREVHMSEAFASTLDLSFEVRGGLLMRQVHHWAALLFLASMSVHMLRNFFTGAFRKPRELNWVIGVTLLVLGVAAGFTGYSLPDDLLSGTGLRIIEGGVLATPVVGTYLSFFLFGGEYPGEDAIARLYSLHILLVPGLILALVVAHLMILWYQKHTHWGGPGKTEKNVVGYPFYPIYVAKAGGFNFVVFGVITLMAATIQINPVWLWGPYDPSRVSAGTQPDWYVGFLDGALRVMPNWESRLFGYTLSWNVLIPSAIIPTIILGGLFLYPWLEQWVTGDRREHHILDRPRNQPVRTGIGVAFITFYVLLWIAGGNDFFATILNIPVNWITWFVRAGVIILPVVMFFVTKRMCLGLQHRDRDKLLHGRESGVIMVSPDGEFSELHASLSAPAAYRLTHHRREVLVELDPEVDENGIPAPRRQVEKVRARLSSFYFGDVVQKPTAAELEAAHHDGHGDGRAALGTGDGHAGERSEIGTDQH
ncbi:MAG: cytochrome bc1 complex cytochrome b subunit [Jiangellaceae bacterium]